ncbi:MAG: hypothetical protein WCO56_10395 [Verrucomicrobiota bacterium]
MKQFLTDSNTGCASRSARRWLQRVALLGLLWPVGWLAAAETSGKDADHPTLKEMKAVLGQTAPDTMVKLMSKTPFKIGKDFTNEVVEVGAPGWAPISGPESEDKFWLVKARTTMDLTRGTLKTNLTLGVMYRVYRGDNQWKAVYAGLYEAGDIEQQARQIGGIFWKTKGSGSPAVRNACINNLRQLDGAKEQWALENKKRLQDAPDWEDLIGFDKYIKNKPECPDGGTYILGTMADRPACSIEGHVLR